MGTRKTKIKMKTYIITYQLRNREKAYDDFYNAIKENMPEYRHAMESVWIVRSDKTAGEIVKLLSPHLYFLQSHCDMIFVSEINKENVDGMIAKSYWPFITDKDEMKDEEKMG